jgi:uncharacterized protein YhaN
MTTPDINEMEKREEAQRLEAEDEIKRLSAINADLLTALKNLRPLFECGAAEEYAEEIEAAEATITEAEGGEGPEERVGPFPRPTGVQRR